MKRKAKFIVLIVASLILIGAALSFFGVLKTEKEDDKPELGGDILEDPYLEGYVGVIKLGDQWANEDDPYWLSDCCGSVSYDETALSGSNVEEFTALKSGEVIITHGAECDNKVEKVLIYDHAVMLGGTLTISADELGDITNVTVTDETITKATYIDGNIVTFSGLNTGWTSIDITDGADTVTIVFVVG